METAMSAFRHCPRPARRAAAFLLGCLLAPAAAHAQITLEMVRVATAGPLIDPAADYWATAPAATVAMLPQGIVAPTQAQAAVPSMQVKAVHNGTWYGFLLEWADPTRSDIVVEDRFGDQVAVQVPMRYQPDALPSPMMGNPGARVSILQWRAPFQRDLDHGEPTTRDLYPNAMDDVYPDQVLRATDARPYMGAVGVDNPISHARRTAVLDQMAEGWGTMTVKTEQHAEGRGAWADGRWRVAISHPMDTGSANDPDLRPGGASAAAFAVWEGGNGEVGSRKAWAPWVTIRLSE